MIVFTNEGNVSQDANFRRHLDDNWDSGNLEFDKIEGLLDTLEKNIDDYQDEIKKLRQSFNNLKDQHTQDVDTLNRTIKKQNDRISKLEDAVFGYGEVEINYDKIPEQDPNDHEVNYRDPMNKDPNNHELNYSSVNGKHRFVEIDTAVNHKLKGE